MENQVDPSNMAKRPHNITTPSVNTPKDKIKKIKTSQVVSLLDSVACNAKSGKKKKRFQYEDHLYIQNLVLLAALTDS